MAVKNPAARDIKKSREYMENLSFDPDFEVLTRIPLTLNPVTNNLERTTSIQGNPSMTLTYDGDGNLTTLTKTIDGTVYTKTFSWAGGRLTDVSTWA
jgi:YD repeat-containing protein